MKKRVIFFLLAIMAVFTLTSCSKKCTVSFSIDGETVHTTNVKKGSTVSEYTPDAKADLTFNGWYKESTLKTKWNFATDVVNDNITLYGKYEEQAHTVHFDLNGGRGSSTIFKDQQVKHNEKATRPTKDPTQTGYTFVNWFLGDTDNVYDFDAPVTQDITIKAHWTEQEGSFHTVTLDLQGGSYPGGVTSVRVADGQPANLSRPTRSGFTFRGWLLDGEPFDTTTPIEEDITLVANWASQGYQSKWTPNQQTGGFDGNNMDFVIMVLPVASYDPYDSNYKLSDKSIRQKQQDAVENAYNIKIKYMDWPSDAPWGPDREDYIKTNYGNGSFKNSDVYVVNITSAWIPNLVKEGCLAELATINRSNATATNGLFTEVGYVETAPGSGIYQKGTYEQNPTNNRVTAVGDKVYGFVSGAARPDFYMYYNADLIEAAGLDDPAEMWLRGEWTWSNFKQFCTTLQTQLNRKSTSDADKYYALTLSLTEFVIGLNASMGNPGIALSDPRLNLRSQTLAQTFTNVRELYNSGFYNQGAGTSDVYDVFKNQHAVFQHGDLWFIGDAGRFDPSQCTFTIGAVPYPLKDGDGIQVVTTTDVNEAIEGFDGQPLTTASGQYIKGVDMSNSSYRIPYTSAGCYSVVNTENGKNGINNKVIFAVLYDLYEGLGPDPDVATVDNDTAYRSSLRTKFDKDIYIEAIMSVQDKSYFEIIEILSMTVGNGSQFGTDGFWPFASRLVKSSEDPRTALEAIYQKYYDSMKNGLGYPLA